MLKIFYQNKTFKFPLKNPTKESSSVYGIIHVDTNWREQDYQSGHQTLNLGATSCFEIPRSLFKAVYEHGDFFYSDQIDEEIEEDIIIAELPKIDFDLQIHFTKTNLTTGKNILIGNVNNTFPSFKEMENLILDKKIINESLLQLGNNFCHEPILEEIRFGKIKENTIHLICQATFEGDEGIGKIEVDVQLPINLYFETGQYAEDFPEKSIKQRLIEIRECFASIYPIDEYNLTEKITDKENKRVQIEFQLKDS